jgi:uncharacterized protein YggU (UPF0235/DUF167 family)
MKYFISVIFNTSELFQVEGKEIKVSLKSKTPIRKGYRKLLKLLSNHFQVFSDKIKIIQGIKSRKKIVHILE